MNKWVCNAIAVLLVCGLSGCTTSSPRFYTLLSSQLQVGMSDAEVTGFIEQLRQDKNRFIRTGLDSIGSECSSAKYLCQNGPDSSVLRRYSRNYYRYPYDVLKEVQNGTPYRYVDYWSSPTGQAKLIFFFDEKTKRLRGWIHQNFGMLQEPLMHERLSSRLHLSIDYSKRMKRDQVVALLGLPVRTIAPPKEFSRAWLEDHFWTMADLSPIEGNTRQIEVYEYELANGQKRHVYLAYSMANYTLIAYGYDQASEEMERYSREKKRSQSSPP